MPQRRPVSALVIKFHLSWLILVPQIVLNEEPLLESTRFSDTSVSSRVSSIDQRLPDLRIDTQFLNHSLVDQFGRRDSLEGASNIREQEFRYRSASNATVSDVDGAGQVRTAIHTSPWGDAWEKALHRRSVASISSVRSLSQKSPLPDSFDSQGGPAGKGRHQS